MSDAIDLDKLEQLARAATPGRWKWRDDHGSVSLDRDVPDHERKIGDHVAFAAPCGCENSSIVIDENDAALIEYASPDFMLEVVARLRRGR
jgi:hypothetical protein